jgi:hypothetical protein
MGLPEGGGIGGAAAGAGVNAGPSPWAEAPGSAAAPVRGVPIAVTAMQPMVAQPTAAWHTAVQASGGGDPYGPASCTDPVTGRCSFRCFAISHMSLVRQRCLPTPAVCHAAVELLRG